MRLLPSSRAKSQGSRDQPQRYSAGFFGLLSFAQNDQDFSNELPAQNLAARRSANRKADSSTYEARNISPDTSFLEMLDIVNDELTERGEAPIAFDSDCREGICGTCALTINGQAHGPKHPAAACQLYMRSFDDGKTITVEPFRAKPFPLVRDLVIDRSALDRIVQAGGFIAARAGSAPEANSIPVPKHNADLAMEAAACIGCGACAAACPNASAMLFTAAKVSHLAFLPQGAPERTSRVTENGAADGRRRFRQLHEHLRMRSGLPGGNQRKFYRETQSRIRDREFATKRRGIRIIAAANSSR